MKEMKLTAEVANMDAVLDFVNAELEAHDVPMKAIVQIDIAVEEIFVNIAHYAYNPDVGPARVTVDVEGEPPCAVISLIDEGKPYDPLSREDPDITLSVEERQIGGLGIFIVKKTMDTVRYTYEDNKNILTMMKKI